MLNLKARGSPDDQFVNLDDVDEVRHWSTEFRITADELKVAVCRVGTSTHRLREYLRTKKQG